MAHRTFSWDKVLSNSCRTLDICHNCVDMRLALTLQPADLWYGARYIDRQARRIAFGVGNQCSGVWVQIPVYAGVDMEIPVSAFRVTRNRGSGVHCSESRLQFAVDTAGSAPISSACYWFMDDASPITVVFAESVRISTLTIAVGVSQGLPPAS